MILLFHGCFISFSSKWRRFDCFDGNSENNNSSFLGVSMYLIRNSDANFVFIRTPIFCVNSCTYYISVLILIYVFDHGAGLCIIQQLVANVIRCASLLLLCFG